MLAQHQSLPRYAAYVDPNKIYAENALPPYGNTRWADTPGLPPRTTEVTPTLAVDGSNLLNLYFSNEHYFHGKLQLNHVHSQCP